MRTSDLSDKRLKFLKQIGITEIVVDPVKESNNSLALTITAKGVPTVNELQEIKSQIEKFDLNFHAIHTIPIASFEEILYGTSKADEQIENIKTLVRNLGEINVPVLGYKWMAKNVQRTETIEVRGGARSTAFEESESDAIREADKGDREYDEETFWENYARFVKEVIPVAEKADVKLAVHPADPPVYDELHGVPSLLRNVGHFRRAMELDPSPYHGIKLCLGCFSEMGENVPAVITEFGEQDKIVLVHFRDVVGTTPAFNETWIDDDESNFDEYEAMKTLYDTDFTGVILPDHVPQVKGDSLWDSHVTGDATPFPKGGPRSRAYSAGYLNGLLKSVDR